MKKLLFIHIAALFTACTTDFSADIAPSALEFLTATFEEDSRIQLNEERKSVWTSGDLVSVFNMNDANSQWQFNGQTGDRTATLVRVTEPSTNNTLEKIVAVYPYCDNYTITDEYKLSATLPNVQHYLAGSYGVNGNIMVSCSEDDNIELKSVMGWLAIQIKGNGEVIRSISLTGNDNEQLAGDIIIDTATATAAFKRGTTSTTLTLNCGDGVMLGSEVTTFYIGTIPQTFEEGFTIRITSDSGRYMCKSATCKVTIPRNTILTMESFEADLISNREIRYTSTDGEIVVPDRADAFGVNILSNSYENGQGIITFDEDITSIGNYAFYDCITLTSITIPDSVTEIGDSIFYCCSNLKEFNCQFATADKRCLIIDNRLRYFAPAEITEYSVPDNVTKIGDHAFYMCSNLRSVTIPNGVTSIGSFTFKGCVGISSITIPDSVLSIADGAFAECINLESVYCMPTTPPTLGNYVFQHWVNNDYQNIGCKIYVPASDDDSIISAYKTSTNWRNYKTDIRELVPAE